MTIQDIKRAIEFCTELELPCEECPYDNVRNCSDTLKLDALKLIIEQESEIKRLKTTLGQCNTELNSALESLKSQCREIGKLRAEVKQAQIDVLKELKARHDYATKNMGYPWDISQQIDKLIKEVENEQKD